MMMNMESVTAKVKGLWSSATSPLKEFDVRESKSQTKFWKIHDAIKKTTSEDVSVFMFDKKGGFEKLPKGSQEEIIAHLKKEALNLQKLRHPAILNVVSGIEDSKSHLYFATEPILSTLDGLLQSYRNRKKSNQSSTDFKAHHFTFEELEIQLGISQLIEGIHFLNQTAKLLHRNICPKTIFITKNMKWKIGGLGFSCSVDNKENINGLSNDLREYGYEEATAILPDLDYLPPEFVQSKRWEYNADLFSVGRIISELTLNLEYAVNDSSSGESMSKLGVMGFYNARLTNLRNEAQRKSHLMDSARVSTILLGESSLRGDCDSFIKSSYFFDVKLKSLVYLSNIVQKEEESKLQFFRGLNRIMKQFSLRMQITYILPTLLSELSTDRTTYVVLPNILLIMTQLEKEYFQSQIASHLIPTLTSKEPKNEVLVCILEHIEILVEKSSQDYTKKYLLPVVLGTLCGPTPEIIFQCLSVAHIVVKFFDPEIISNGVLPRLTNLVVGGFPLHIRTKAINWFSLLVPLMDKKIIIEFLIPSLERILSNDNSPPILEALVYTYEAISKKIGGEMLALKVLPALIPLSADKHLDLEQFKTIMRVVKDVLTAYEAERFNEFNNVRKYTKSDTPINSTATTSSSSQADMDKFNNVLNPSQSSLDNGNPFAENNSSNTVIEPVKITLPPSFKSPPSSSTNTFKNSSEKALSPQPSASGGGFNSNKQSVFDSPDFSSVTPSNNSPIQSPISNNYSSSSFNYSGNLSFNPNPIIQPFSTNNNNNSNNNNSGFGFNNNGNFNNNTSINPTTTKQFTPNYNLDTSNLSSNSTTTTSSFDSFTTPITPTTTSSTQSEQNTTSNLSYNPSNFSSNNYYNNNSNFNSNTSFNNSNSSNSNFNSNNNFNNYSSYNNNNNNNNSNSFNSSKSGNNNNNSSLFMGMDSLQNNSNALGSTNMSNTHLTYGQQPMNNTNNNYNSNRPNNNYSNNNYNNNNNNNNNFNNQNKGGNNSLI